MTAFIPYQVHSAEILQASAGKYNVLVFFKAKGIITVMTLGLKKPEIDCKITRQSCICSHLISLFFQSPKLGYITSRYKSKKKIMNHT